MPKILSCTEKLLVFSDLDTQFPTVAEDARKRMSVGKTLEIKLYITEESNVFFNF